MTEPVDWTGGVPRSQRFGDIYFSPEDGLAETRAVFLQGCGLPGGWAERNRFVVGETGFGSGLNVLALLDLWRRTRPSPLARLHIFSVEGFPMSAEDAARALAAFPELTDLTAPLLADWPRGRRGFHRYEWPCIGVILDLAVMEVAEALRAWSGFADAWFLDGFAPSKNPDMWRAEVLSLVAARSAGGARLGSFTVAGAVRRGLEEAGFVVRRAPGYGAKRQRLEGVYPHEAKIHSPPPQSIAVIGAGVAGAALVRAFRRLGVMAEIFDAEGPGAGASGNAAALVTPRLDAGLGPAARLSAQTFARAIQIYRTETPDAILSSGVAHLARQEKDPQRFEIIAGWDGFDDGDLAPLSLDAVAAALGEASGAEGLMLKTALVVEPQKILEAWAPHVTRRRIVAMNLEDGRWMLQDSEGLAAGRFDAVVLAAGPACAALADGLGLRPVRGQVSHATGVDLGGCACSWGDYAAQTREGLIFGATHGRDDADADVRLEDDARNLSALSLVRPRLAERARAAGVFGRAAVRAATKDHLPLAGPLAPAAPDDASPGTGLFILSGLGGRGFAFAPLLAEFVAATVMGAPSPLPIELSRRLDPTRFQRRRTRA